MLYPLSYEGGTCSVIRGELGGMPEPAHASTARRL